MIRNMTRLFRASAPLLLVLSHLGAISATAQQAAQKINTFVSKEGRFSVQLSDRPKYSTQAVGEGAGATVNHIFMLEKGDAAYYVSFSDFKPELIKDVSIAKLLDSARDGGVSNSKGKLLSEKNITLDGSPGREIAIDLPGDQKTKARARFYMVSDRLYTVIFAGSYSAADSATTDAFLASLKIRKYQAVPGTWMVLDSPEGRFQIKMPGKPVASVDPPGKKDAVHLWQLVSDKDEVSYFVAFSDLPAVLTSSEDIERALDGGRDAIAKSLKATVADESLLSVDGNPGREAHMQVGPKDAPDALIQFRGFIVKDRYYQVMAIGSKAAMEKGRPDDYMDCFQLIRDASTTK